METTRIKDDGDQQLTWPIRGEYFMDESGSSRQSPTRRRVLKSLGGAASMIATTGLGNANPALAQGLASKGGMTLDGHVLVPKDKLNELVARFYPAFNHNSILPPFSPDRHGARFDVVLRRITTFTRVPETGQQVKVSGLLAVPANVRGRLPVVSYQHGTILSFDQVPSNLLKLGQPGYELSDSEDSLETLFNVQRLAGNGFAVIAADYLGKGPFRQGRSEAYGVKGATVQCCLDILSAGSMGLTQLGLGQSALFLNGWSQGGLNTQWLKQELERRRVSVAATAMQSPFNNLAEALRYWSDPQSVIGIGSAYPSPPNWVSLCVIIVLGSYREYYKMNDLFRAAIKPKHLPFAEKYWRDYTLTPTDLMAVPKSVSDLLVEGFSERFTHDVDSDFVRKLGESASTYWKYNSPVRFYYGLQDEALHPSMMSLALASAGRFGHGIGVEGASHRGTVLASLYGEGKVVAGESNLLDWFQKHLKG